MTKDIFFCDNTKKPPAGGDKEEEEGGQGEKKKFREVRRCWRFGEKARKQHVFVGCFSSNGEKHTF